MAFEHGCIRVGAREIKGNEDVQHVKLLLGDAAVDKESRDSSPNLVCGNARFGNAVIGVAGEHGISKRSMIEEPCRTVGKNNRYIHMPPFLRYCL